MKHLIFTALAIFTPLFIPVYCPDIFFAGYANITGLVWQLSFRATIPYINKTEGRPGTIGLLTIITGLCTSLALAGDFATWFFVLAISVLVLIIMVTNFSSYFFINRLSNQKNQCPGLFSANYWYVYITHR